ncbi:MAG: lipopolysaccharide biosynthesis protein [Burkholderiaceae bacterium]|nr:lipopolysaccharide biosynthesis protein [Burkholderiaceae bacterium]
MGSLMPRALLGQRLVGEAGWVFVGQALSALGTLVGLRLVTEAVPPSVYGTVALAVGMVALAQGVSAVPLMQAVLRFYPEFESASEGMLLRRALLRSLRLPAAGSLLVLIAVLAAWLQTTSEESLGVTALCGVLFLVEVARSVELTLLNAKRDQRTMALLVMADAWARPVAAVVMVWLAADSAAAVIGGYLLGAVAPLAIFYLFRRLTVVAGPTAEEALAAKRLWTYAKPLVPLPFVGWVSGQADRYLLAAVVGMQPAGIYAALYGLASRPFLMLAAGIELALRQIYYGYVSAGNRVEERRTFWLWLAASLGASLSLLLAIALFHQQIAALLLAAEYRVHSALMIWIAAGYVLAAVTQVVERVCYALHDTRGVLLVQGAGAALSVVVALPMIHWFGLEGAAWAVPIYFGAQMVLTLTRARWALQARQSAPAATVTPRLAETRHV